MDYCHSHKLRNLSGLPFSRCRGDCGSGKGEKGGSGSGSGENGEHGSGMVLRVATEVGVVQVLM